MKQTIALICAAIAAILCVMCVEQIPAGTVGVVYSTTGIEEETLKQGWHFVSPLKKVKEFPISQQQAVFSDDPADYNEKKHDDWSIDAPANGGMVKINLTVNYSFIEDGVVELYKRFNGMDGEEIINNRVQNSIIAYVKEVTPRFTVMDIYSDKKSEVNAALTEYLNEKIGAEYSILIHSALIIDVELDETLQEKIKAKEQAKQDAEIAELDRQTAIARAETEKTLAQTEADVAVIKAEAEAEANRIISESITQQLIDMKEAEARLEHGWVTVQGADAVVTTQPEVNTAE